MCGPYFVTYSNQRYEEAGPHHQYSFPGALTLIRKGYSIFANPFSRKLIPALSECSKNLSQIDVILKFDPLYGKMHGKTALGIRSS